MTTRRVLTACVLLASGFALLPGCAGPGHGKHTEAFRQEARNRMASLKAATNWDMAQQQFLTGDLDKALRTIDTSLAHSPQVAKSHLLRGRIMLELDRLEPAIESLATASVLDATDAEPHYYLGVIYERVSRPESAFEAYQKAADLDEHNPQYVLASAEMLIAMERLEEAEELLTNASSTFEHNAGIRQTLGHIALMQDDTPEAVRHFQEASLLGPDDVGLLEDLARAQLASGDFAEAEYTLRRLIENLPEERDDIERLLARCLITLDRPVEARDLLVKIVERPRGASDVESWIDLGGVCMRIGDRFRLRQAGQRLMSLAPEREDGYMLTAWWQHLEGRPGDAVAMLDRAMRLTGEISGPSMLQSLIHQSAGDLQAAIEAVDRAQAADPTDTEIRRLAFALRQSATVADVPVD